MISVVSVITTIIISFLILIIAGIVAYIGCLQYRVSKRQQKIAEEKFNLDMFDKRFKVFDATRTFFLKIIESGNINLQEIREFRVSTIDAVFLFDDEISKYLEEVIRKALKLQKIILKCKGLHAGTKRLILCKEQEEIVEWFHSQYLKLQNAFSPYLKFRVWREN